MTRKELCRVLLFLAALLLSEGRPCLGETVALPITIDYPMLRSVLVSQAYTGPGQVGVPFDEADGCYRIELRDPETSAEGNHLRISSKLKVRAGVPMLGRCLEPVEWEGTIDLVEDLWIVKEKWLLTFETVDSRLYDKNRQPVLVSELWDLVKTHVQPYFEKVTFSLLPPIQELHVSLPLFVPPEDRERATRWLASLRPGTAWVSPEAVRVNILMDVEMAAPEETGKPAALSPEELEEFTRTWETWDSFVVFQILALGGETLTDAEARVLLETLLDTRYQFLREAIAQTPGPDLVRRQFLQVWEKLAPILRKHLMENPKRSPLDYLAFFAAADALATLDKLGPTLDIDVSRNGLLRLASLLAQQEGAAPNLEYSTRVDPVLRRTLGMGAPLDESGPAFPADHLDLGGSEPQEQPPPGPTGLGTRLLQWLCGTAWAAAPPPQEAQPAAAEIAPWTVPDEDPRPYLDRLRATLDDAAAKALAGGKLDPRHHALYRLLVTATAWQESCWRQFVKQGGQVTYLRSWNNTSVGLMQINERVWRGIYNPASLRWNAPYNARAGAEVLEQYFSRYAVGRMNSGKPLEPDLLARAGYAMYNGGPGDFDRFLERNEKRSLCESDRLFEEKFLWVKNAEWDRLSGCLPGL